MNKPEEIYIFPEGTLVEKTYRIDKLINKGGMGVVYKAMHVRLGRKVALKVMLPDLIDHREKKNRFFNEAMGVADLRHRNIVNITDVGSTENGMPFFVMEFLEGETLAARLRRQIRLSSSETAEIMTQALTGLSVLHSRGILHRDLKPSNVFISKEEDETELVKLMDFGVSKFQLFEGSLLTDQTASGTILGTPSYMSPEQAMGKRKLVDFRSDIYSCGVILYQALTGLNPFKGENYNETLHYILSAIVAPPSMLAPDFEPKLDPVVMRAIERDKQNRYQTCQEFIDALRPLKSKEKIPTSEKKSIEVDPELSEAPTIRQVSPPPIKPPQESTNQLFMATNASKIQVRRSQKIGIILIAITAVVLPLSIWGMISLLKVKGGADSSADSSPDKLLISKINVSSTSVVAPIHALDALSIIIDAAGGEWGDAGGVQDMDKSQEAYALKPEASPKKMIETILKDDEPLVITPSPPPAKNPNKAAEPVIKKEKGKKPKAHQFIWDYPG